MHTKSKDGETASSILLRVFNELVDALPHSCVGDCDLQSDPVPDQKFLEAHFVLEVVGSDFGEESWVGCSHSCYVPVGMLDF